MPPLLRQFRNANELAEASAEALRLIAGESLTARGRFSLALSGGQSPRKLFERLASEAWNSLIPWEWTDIFWVDERCVPLGSPDSNEGVARELLLSKIKIQAANVHPMTSPGKMSPEEAAAEYEKTLLGFFGESVPFPVFDLILLGMGSDGHTASLFPESDALKEDSRWVLPILNPPESAKPCVPRLTLTLPLLNAARNTIFIVTGKDKSELARKIIGNSPETAALPAALVRPKGNISWHLAAE